MSAELILLDDFELEETVNTLRPACLDDLIGQDEIKDQLREPIEAAKITGKHLRHLLLTGPAGLGKTTIAEMMANELGVGFEETTGEALSDSGSLLKILIMLEERSILFIDEIHLLNKKVMQALYRAMEDFKFPVVVGRGPSAETRVVKVPKFTLIGATTDTADLKKPLLDRFRLRAHLSLYSENELLQIAVRSAQLAGYTIDYEAAAILAKRSRGTPRLVNNHLDGLVDRALLYGGDKHISASTARGYFASQGIDELGLKREEQAYLKILCERFNGGRVGIKNLASALGEEMSAVEEMERFLIQKQLLIKAENGRYATRGAFVHLRMKLPFQPKGLEMVETLERL